MFMLASLVLLVQGPHRGGGGGLDSFSPPPFLGNFVFFFPEDLRFSSRTDQFQTTKLSRKHDICKMSNAFSLWDSNFDIFRRSTSPDLSSQTTFTWALHSAILTNWLPDKSSVWIWPATGSLWEPCALHGSPKASVLPYRGYLVVLSSLQLVFEGLLVALTFS